jgi:hypothetical protein
MTQDGMGERPRDQWSRFETPKKLSILGASRKTYGKRDCGCPQEGAAKEKAPPDQLGRTELEWVAACRRAFTFPAASRPVPRVSCARPRRAAGSARHADAARRRSRLGAGQRLL